MSYVKWVFLKKSSRSCVIEIPDEGTCIKCVVIDLTSLCFQLAGGLKRTAAPAPIKPPETSTKKQKVPKKKKKKDPNEPQKWVPKKLFWFEIYTDDM